MAYAKRADSIYKEGQGIVVNYQPKGSGGVTPAGVRKTAAGVSDPQRRQ